MEECEICGTKAKDIYIVDVEDVELRVCTKCAKGKKVVSKVVERTNLPRRMQIGRREDAQPLVENYGTVMHNARESMKLPLKVLAEMLNEKETLLLRVEQQRTMPSTALTKRLEKALGIKLTESGEPDNSGSAPRNRSDRITLKDYITKKE